MRYDDYCYFHAPGGAIGVNYFSHSLEAGGRSNLKQMWWLQSLHFEFFGPCLTCSESSGDCLRTALAFGRCMARTSWAAIPHVCAISDPFSREALHITYLQGLWGHVNLGWCLLPLSNCVTLDKSCDLSDSWRHDSTYPSLME